ncbi:MAG: hypothetical protein ACREMS_03835 [Gemmatimonadaceae bacterium]
MHRQIQSVALLAAFALAACSTDVVAPTSQVKAVNAHVSHIQGSQLAPHSFAPAHYQLPVALGSGGVTLSSLAARNDAVAAAAPLNIQYWGGGVIQKQSIAAIYYSPTTIYRNGPRPGTSGNGETDNSLVGFYLKNLAKSAYWNTNSTYFDEIGNKDQNFIKDWMDYKSFWAANQNAPNPGNTVSEDDMVFLIESGFANGTLKYDPNTLYMIFTGPGVNLGGGFSNDELDYCAFHSGYWFNDGGPIVQFGAMPYDAEFNPDHPSKHNFVCTFLTNGPNGDLGADATVSGLTHETEETATDPVSLTVPPFFAGWYDVQGEENGDKCAYVYGPTTAFNGLDFWNVNFGGKQFLIQQNWSNVSPQGCRTGLNGPGTNGNHGAAGVAQ